MLASEVIAGNPYASWQNGPPKADTWFPIGIWYQDIRWAQDYADAGINVYIYLDGLWRVGGDQDAGLQYLRNAGIRLITNQQEWNGFVDDPIIIGWLQQDEPDNAQAIPGGGYDPPITPAEIHSRYNSIKAADDTRPVYVNFGRGAAYDPWIGRGVRTNHPEDYPQYIAGGTDIASFDIYPANSTDGAAGQLWRVAYGTARLVQWSDSAQPVWSYIETTHIDTNRARKPTAIEVRAEVWMALIHGARGISYFAHQISPFNADALREDSDMLASVSKTNHEIHNLAPALYRPNIDNLATLASLVPDTPFNDTGIPPEVARLGFVVREYEGYYYLFAVGLRDRTMQATFDLAGFTGSHTAVVIGEDRSVNIVDGQLSDTFDDYQAHLYRFENPANPRRFRIVEHGWAAGEFSLRWTVEPNAIYRISHSTDLKKWTPLAQTYISSDSDLTLRATIAGSEIAYSAPCFMRVEKP